MFRRKYHGIEFGKAAALTCVLALIVALGMGGTSATAQAQSVDETLHGGLGGTLAQFQEEWGTPSWTDTGLIGYDNLALNGVDTIVVAWYDATQAVYEVDLVYLEQPGEFSNRSAVADVVAVVAPRDGTCGGDALPISGLGPEVYACSSAALQDRYSAEDYANSGLRGDDGSYSYSIDPYADEYYEIIVQWGTDSDQPPPTEVPPPPTEVPQPPTEVPTIGGPAPGGCAYDPCLPPPPPDLDCPDVGGPVIVLVPGVDPHGLDRDNDGVGCE